MKSCFLISMVFILASCQGREPEPAKRGQAGKDAPTKTAAKTPEPIRAEKLDTAVPRGKQLPCEALYSLEGFSRGGQKNIAKIVEHNKTDKSATAVCALILGGKRLGKQQQKRKLARNSERLGTLAGDEVCRVTTKCSAWVDVERFASRCERGQGAIAEDMSFQACATSRPSGDRERFKFVAIEPESGCRIEVIGGPSVTGRSQVATCTKAAVGQIRMDTITRALMQNKGG